MTRCQILVVLILAGIPVMWGCDQPTSPAQDDPIFVESANVAYASGGIHFCYRPQAADSNHSSLVFTFPHIPPWAAVDADSVFGQPANNSKDDSIVVVVSNGESTDSATVRVRMVAPLVVYGDSRTGHDVHRRIVAEIMEVHPATVFHSGDLVGDGTLQRDWDIFNEIVADMLDQTEFFPAIGNHERQSQLFFNNFDLPGNEQWYSVVRNRVHFIVLNSCVDISPGSEQYQWLVDDLSSVADSIWFTVAVFHHPPYSTGSHAEDEMGLRDILVPLFEQYGVDIIFNGHDHDYERSYCGDIFYIVTGGGGAPLRDQTRDHPCSQLFLKQYHFCKLSALPERMFVTVVNDSGRVIDDFSLPVRPRNRHHSSLALRHGTNPHHSRF